MALVTERPLVGCKDGSRPVVVSPLCLDSRAAHLGRISTVVDNVRCLSIPPQRMFPSGRMTPVAGNARYRVARAWTIKIGIVIFRMILKGRNITRCFCEWNERGIRARRCATKGPAHVARFDVLIVIVSRTPD